MGVLQDLESIIRADQPSCPSTAACLARLGTPTLSIAVLEDGVISSHCFSAMNHDTETVFQAASISKPVTAMAVMKLIEEGKFSLESTIGDLLPCAVLDLLTEDSPKSQASMIGRITVKQLLSHTSGLSVHGFSGYPTLSTDLKVPSARDVLRGHESVNSMRVRLNGLPGQVFTYSGGGITVLQIILETVTGRKFATLMRQMVLEPLGMTRSNFGRLRQSENNTASAYYNGYTPCESRHHIFPEEAAAGLWTTPTDLLRVVQAVQKSLDDDDGFLRKDTARQMLTEIDAGMALSWRVPGEQKVTFEHFGENSPGFHSSLTGFADLNEADQRGVSTLRNSGLAVMTNSAMGYVALWKVRQAVAHLKHWPSVLGWEGPQIPATPLTLPGENPGSLWEFGVGKWTDGKHDLVVKADKDGKPVVIYNGNAEIRLLPAAIPAAMEPGNACCALVLEGLNLLLHIVVKEQESNTVLRLLSPGKTIELVAGQ